MSEEEQELQHQISLAALHEYVEKCCNGNSQLISCAESCYYWFNKNIMVKEKI